MDSAEKAMPPAELRRQLALLTEANRALRMEMTSASAKLRETVKLREEELSQARRRVVVLKKALLASWKTDSPQSSQRQSDEPSIFPSTSSRVGSSDEVTEDMTLLSRMGLSDPLDDPGDFFSLVPLGTKPVSDDDDDVDLELFLQNDSKKTQTQPDDDAGTDSLRLRLEEENRRLRRSYDGAFQSRHVTVFRRMRQLEELRRAQKGAKRAFRDYVWKSRDDEKLASWLRLRLRLRRQDNEFLTSSFPTLPQVPPPVDLVADFVSSAMSMSMSMPVPSDPRSIADIEKDNVRLREWARFVTAKTDEFEARSKVVEGKVRAMWAAKESFREDLEVRLREDSKGLREWLLRRRVASAVWKWKDVFFALQEASAAVAVADPEEEGEEKRPPAAAAAVLDDDEAHVEKKKKRHAGELGKLGEWFYEWHYSNIGIHDAMLRDVVRNDAYYDAMKKNPRDFRGKVVLDIGSGTGILALMAAAAGAKKVERTRMALYARRIIEKHSYFRTKIEVIRQKMEKVVLPEPVDVIVSEWMGNALFNEGVLPTVLEARDRLQKNPGWKFYPNVTRLCLVGAYDSGKLMKKKQFFDRSVCGFDFSVLKILMPNHENVRVDPKYLVTKSVVLKEFDLQTCTLADLSFETRFSLEVKEDAQIHICGALVMFFEVEFGGPPGETVVLSTDPIRNEKHPTHWMQQMMSLGERFHLSKTEGQGLGCLNGTIRVCPGTECARRLCVEVSVSHGDVKTEQLYMM